MSMAANKIPGVRAALVFDETMAALSRQHNNANVLCLGARNTPARAGPKNSRHLSGRQFEGGRHERRVNKMETSQPHPASLRLENS